MILPIASNAIKSCTILSTDMPVDYIGISDSEIELIIPQMLYKDCGIPVVVINK